MVRGKYRGRPYSDFLCSYCGLRPADDMDHALAQALFNKPLPGDMIRVPACDECHRPLSALDEQFAAYISLQALPANPESLRHWRERGSRSIKHNAALFRKILADMQDVSVVTESGIYIGEGGLVPWPKPEHDRYMQRIVRGLYRHHYDAVLGLGVVMHTFQTKGREAIFADLYQTCTKRSIGGDQFKYAYGEASDEPLASVWFT